MHAHQQRESFLSSKYFGPLTVIVMLVVQVSFFFNWSRCKSTTISFFVDINTTTRSQASSALNNMIILSVLNVRAAYRHPSCLVTMPSRTEALRLTEREASLLRAIDHTVDEMIYRGQAERNEEIKDYLARVQVAALEMISKKVRK
jgi:hypothetical protein